MSLQPNRFLVLCIAGFSLTIGCKNDEACTKARFAATDAWKTINETAGKNKVAPNIGLDELAADKKAPHVEAWGTIEKQAEMISASFAYDMITWKTSDPAQQKANAAFDSYFAKDMFKSFELQLREANEKYKAAATACRE